MTVRRPRMRPLSRGQLLEILLTLVVLAGLAASLIDYREKYRLPQPFYFGINESLTDWFVTAQFAHQSGAYDVFDSIYPPISFLFMRLTTLPSCYAQDAYYARECDYVARFVIVLFYILSAVVAGWAFWKNDRSTALMRTIAFALGFPLLFALERGNTITVCFVCFVLGYGGILRSRTAQVFAIALALNFKPYLLAPAAADAIKRNWRYVEQVALVTFLVYSVSYAVFGQGDPLTIFKNISYFSEATVSFIWERIYYATSLEGFQYFNSYRFPTRDFIDGRIIDVAYVVIFIMMYTSVALILLTVLAAWLRPLAVPRLRLMLLLLCSHLVTAAEAGYLFIFVVFLVFMERSRSRLTTTVVIFAYLQCIPYDIVLTHFLTLTGDSWLSGHSTEFALGPAVGMFLRPVLLNVMVWLLAIDSLIPALRSWRGTSPVLGLGRPQWLTA